MFYVVSSNHEDLLLIYIKVIKLKLISLKCMILWYHNKKEHGTENCRTLLGVYSVPNCRGYNKQGCAAR